VNDGTLVVVTPNDPSEFAWQRGTKVVVVDGDVVGLKVSGLEVSTTEEDEVGEAVL